MWLLDRIRGSVDHSNRQTVEAGDKQGKGGSYSNVLTPDKIPDFFIPPKLIPTEGGGAEGEAVASKPNIGTSASEQNLSGRRPQRSPRLPTKAVSESKNLVKAANRHIIQIESADEWASEEDLGTNADPQSQSAMSLPYVPKAQTSYGFVTLLESPHTRRKESLFHSEQGSLSPCPSQSNSPSSQRRSAEGGGGSQLNPSDFGMSLMNPYRYFSGGESDTCSSAESSPFSSPLLSRSVSLLKIFTPDTQSKLMKFKHSVARNSSLSTDECSSADTSPSMPRRRARGAKGAGIGAGQQGATPLELLQKEHTVCLSKGGSMRLSAEYDPSNARLRVRLIAAEHLFDKLCDLKGVNCCVVLYLNPGKVHRQRSTIIKNSRNPVFNEDFFFDGLVAGSAKKMSLKIKVLNKGSSLKRDTLLGEKEIPLTALLPFL
ncbi:C2 calcium-dependent domain-containing protein 4C [Gastrophryne carolinensis]